MTYRIVDIVNLVEYDPLDILEVGRVVVEHLLQDLSSHDHARCVGVERDISSANTNYQRLIMCLSYHLRTCP